MRLNFHGPLRDLYGPSFDIEAVTVADAIEGFSRQAPNWPKHMRVAAVGHPTVESLQETPDEVDLMPAMAGGGGKFGTILLGAALIGVGIFTGGLGTAIGTSLLVSGGMMALQGVMGLFMKAPKFNQAQDPEASKYISVNKNTTAINTPITLAWGRINIAGHWLSLQSDSNNLSFGSFPENPT